MSQSARGLPPASCLLESRLRSGSGQAPPQEGRRERHRGRDIGGAKGNAAPQRGDQEAAESLGRRRHQELSGLGPSPTSSTPTLADRPPRSSPHPISAFGSRIGVGARVPEYAPRGRAPVATGRESTLGDNGPGHPDPERACEAVHRALEQLPQLSAPSQTTVADGLYFFYERGETSTHAPHGGGAGRNHPGSDGTLVRRLSQHFSGGKNGSVFRKALGGALLRQSDASHPCLAPAPGRGTGNGRPAVRIRPRG